MNMQAQVEKGKLLSKLERKRLPRKMWAVLDRAIEDVAKVHLHSRR